MRKTTILILCLLAAASAFAKQISEQEAFAKAEQFMQGKKLKTGRRLMHGAQAKQTFKSLYIFNAEANGGFVIVSGDDRTQSILGYADEGSFDELSIPNNAKWLLDYYDKAIVSLSNNNTYNFRTRSTNRMPIETLIKTQWSQDSPYNKLCPEQDGVHCVTGCIATAMAQVINYHQWTKIPTGAVPAYLIFGENLWMEELPATTFDWSNPDDDFIARLMLYCGQSVEMQYGKIASGAFEGDIPQALSKIFGYSNRVQRIYKGNYTEEDWDDLIYSEIKKGYPVIYCGQNSEGSSHCFIVDGYSDNSLYHVNWGWGGVADGYFLLSTMNPNNDDFGFNLTQTMIANIRPLGNIEEILITLQKMSYSQRYIQREGASSPFPPFEINVTFETNAQKNTMVEIGLALYSGNTMLSLLNSETIEVAQGITYTKAIPITLDTDLPNGDYSLAMVSRSIGSDEWVVCKDNDESDGNAHIEICTDETGALLTLLSIYNSFGDHKSFDIPYSKDGICYRLFFTNDQEYYAFLQNPESGKYEGNIVIPNTITWYNKPFIVQNDSENALVDSPNLKSLTIMMENFDGIYNCPELENLFLTDGVYTVGDIHDCPMITEITYPTTCREIAPVYSMLNLNAIRLTRSSSVKIRLRDGLIWDKESMPALTDIYFSSTVPPTAETLSAIPANPNVTIHIPQGTKDVYKNSIWKEWCLEESDTPTPMSVKWSYCGNNEDEFTNSGGYCGGIMENVEWAIYIPSDLIKPYKDCKITSVEYYVTPNLNTYTNPEYAFISTGKGYEVKKATTRSVGTWTTVTFDQPLQITGEALYVGLGRRESYLYTNSTFTKKENSLMMRVVPYGNDASTDWGEPCVQEVADNPLAIRAVIEGTNMPTDIVIDNVEVVETKTRTSQKTLRATMCNRTPRVVKNIVLDWNIDGIANGQYIIETAMFVNQEETINIDIPNNVTAGRHHTISISVASVDGEPDKIHSNSTAEVTYTSVPAITFPKKTVMEEATGTWCEHCPIGIMTIEYMNNKYPDDFIAIAIHNDEMTPAFNSYQPFFNMVSEYPSARINRSYWIGLWPFDIEDMKDSGEAMIKAEAEFIQGNKIDVSTETTFGFSDDGSTEYRIAYVVTEDKVGPYYQANAFSNPDAEDNPDHIMNWWIHQGPYVEMTFNDVARAIYDYDGIAGQLPKVITEGETYKCQYTVTLPDNIQNVENLSIVTLLLDTRTGEILNADRTAITGDPTVGIKDVKDSAGKTFDVYDITGTKVRNHATTLNGLPKGIYIVNGAKVIVK